MNLDSDHDDDDENEQERQQQQQPDHFQQDPHLQIDTREESDDSSSQPVFNIDNGNNMNFEQQQQQRQDEIWGESGEEPVIYANHRFSHFSQKEDFYYFCCSNE